MSLYGSSTDIADKKLNSSNLSSHTLQKNVQEFCYLGKQKIAKYLFGGDLRLARFIDATK